MGAFHSRTTTEPYGLYVRYEPVQPGSKEYRVFERAGRFPVLRRSGFPERHGRSEQNLDAILAAAWSGMGRQGRRKDIGSCVICLQLRSAADAIHEQREQRIPAWWRARDHHVA